MSKKTLIGKVVSDKMQKTVVVAVEVPTRHTKYTKLIKNTRRYKARNEINAVTGNMVRLEECPPYSKEVSWKLIEVIVPKEKKK